MKKKCSTSCNDTDDKLVQFLRAPNELNADQEIETRDWSEWDTAGKSYASIHTAGSRAVYVANQTHQSFDAVIECAWNSITRVIGSNHAIKRMNFGEALYFHVIAAINVDFKNQRMRFLCRITTPNGIQED